MIGSPRKGLKKNPGPSQQTNLSMQKHLENSQNTYTSIVITQTRVQL